MSTTTTSTSKTPTPKRSLPGTTKVSTKVSGRPGFYRSYSQELALFNTRPKQVAVGAVILLGLLGPFVLEDALLRTLAIAFVFAIGALGLNIVTGLAGQVSLGHAFFLGVGAYTAAAISGDPEGRTIGFGIEEMWIWLPVSGLVAAAFGVAVAPLATRLRGLYLAIVTLGLVFIGEHVFREWSDLTGGAGVGRSAATPQLFGFDFSQSTEMFSREQQLYLLMFVLMLVFALGARNLARSRVGRAFSAVRDRDMAAEMMSIDLPRTKALAFGISSFYAGCAGALLYTVSGFFDPASFNLLLSVQFIAMVLIGGAGTVGGTIAGALFVSLLPTLTRELPNFIPLISRQVTETPNVFQIEQVLYGLLIVGFLLFEPRGLYGIWMRIRIYWKSWPFSY